MLNCSGGRERRGQEEKNNERRRKRGNNRWTAGIGTRLFQLFPLKKKVSFPLMTMILNKDEAEMILFC